VWHRFCALSLDEVRQKGSGQLKELQPLRVIAIALGAHAAQHCSAFRMFGFSVRLFVGFSGRRLFHTEKGSGVFSLASGTNLGLLGLLTCQYMFLTKH